MTWKSLWRKLSAEQREAACLAFWQNEELDAAVRDAAVGMLARALRFRTRMVRRLPVEKLARYMAGRGSPDSEAILFALQSFLLTKRPMLAHFLDALGIPHEDGLISGQEGIPKVERASLESAVRQLYSSFPVAEVGIYLRFLVKRDPDAWEGLESILEEQQIDAIPAAPAQTSPEQLVGAEGQDQAGRPDSPSFSTLDRIIVRSVIDAASEIQGALSLDELEDLVDEVLHLNSDRRSTYFHLGFKDELLGRDLVLDFPEANLERRTWILAGALHAAGRRGCHERVMELVEAHHPEAAGMLAGPHSTGPGTVHLMFDALVKVGRVAELPQMVSVENLAEAGPALWLRIAWEAGRLVREHRGAEAEPLIDHAGAAVVAAAEGDGLTEDEAAIFGDLQRRKAHCLRLRGAFSEAETLLRGLVEDASDDRKAMVLADLGLIRAGYRSLTDVKLPAETTRFRDVAAALGKGEEFFLRSAHCRQPWGGHGQYCLGILHLAQGRKSDALPHLERAVAEMQRRPETYGHLILPRARLYLGACLADTLDPARAQHSAECILDGVAQLGDESLPLLSDALVALDVAAPSVCENLTREVFAKLGNRLLDVAIGTGALQRVPELRRALADRALNEGRSAKQRHTDFLALMKAARGAREVDMELGALALDGLEALALEGVGRDSLMNLLLSDEYKGFLWSPEDVLFLSVRLLEGQGRLEEAASILGPLAHEILTKQDRPDWLAEAEDLTGLIASYGLEPDPSLTARVEKARAGNPRAVTAQATGKVVFVGGNETQARYDADIKQHVRRNWPAVELVLLHPGWTSNWGRQFKQWEWELRSADAIVVMRFVRTQFGREIRRLCSELDKSWVACTGHGKTAIQNAIEAAIALL